jgi:tetratricopeptide (TPR) repeat protein
MSRSGLGLVGLVIFCLSGCTPKYDPFKQQVLQAQGLSLQGEQSFSQGDLPQAAKNFSRALEVSRAVDNPQGVARELNNLGAVALEQGDLKKAAELFSQAWEINRTHQQWSDGSVTQANLATAAQKAGKWEAAAQHLRLAQDAADSSRSLAARGRVLIRWASFYLDEQNYAAAATALDQARKLATTVSLKGAWAYQKGRLALAQKNTSEALSQFHQALSYDRQILDRAAMAADLFGLGEAHQLRGEMPQAWEYYSRAFDVYFSLGTKAPLSRCLTRLEEVNAQGRLGNSLTRFQKEAQPKPPGDK